MELFGSSRIFSELRRSTQKSQLRYLYVFQNSKKKSASAFGAESLFKLDGVFVFLFLRPAPVFRHFFFFRTKACAHIANIHRAAAGSVIFFRNMAMKNSGFPVRHHCIVTFHRISCAQAMIEPGYRPSLSASSESCF